MTTSEREDGLLRSAALQNVQSILEARQRAEDALLTTKQQLEAETARLDRTVALLRATLEATTDGIVAIDEQAKVTAWNQRFKDIWHVPAAILDNGDWRELSEFAANQLADPAGFVERVDAIQTQALPESFDVLEFADGRSCVRYSRPQLIGGAKAGRVWTFRDTTERKRAEAANALLAAIVQGSDDAIVAKDLFGVITSWNEGAQRMFGYAPEEAIGQPITMLIPRARLAEETYILDCIRRGERVEHFDTVRMRKDRTLIDVSLTISPVRDASGRVVGASKIARDITDRVRLERETRDQAQALSDLHRRKDEFLAMLGHELRNPLAPIANAVHILRLQKSDDPLQQQARAIIDRQVAQLTRLVDDLLEVSRITTGRIYLRQEPVALNGVVESACETVRPLIEQRQHALEVSVPPEQIWVSGDAARLEQVVVNLLTNAAKYTPDEGRLGVSLEQEGDEAVLRVRDNGIGIASDLLPRVFELFTQAERSLDRSQGGLGIGLALVQRLVEMHGGRVEVDSALGQGSQFVVWLPLTRTAAVPERSIAASLSASGNHARVLIVDDNVDAVQSVAILLQSCGHEVTTAHDGPAALAAAFEAQPDVVLLDLGLPGLNGYEVAKRLREHAVLRDVMLVAMTGYGLPADRQRTEEAGFDHHLIKPAEFEQLQQIIASAKKRRIPQQVAFSLRSSAP
ncbi:MAG TPA: PAS domain S-box protein [Casimicrobiaceae bacterium]|nr:PAS domain S-box protein [Casimicrobiaceae bacterium]